MSQRRIFTFLFILLLSVRAFAQNDLEATLLGEMGKPVDYTMSTFLSTYVMNNQSTELLNKNGIGFRISHKFGTLNSGAQHFFGFDEANSFLEVNYGIADWLNVGLARETQNETVNGYTKFRLLRQSTGARIMPFSLVLLLDAHYKTQVFDNPERNKNIPERFDYTSQLLFSRKFCSLFSAQLTPTFIHRNLVETKNDQNNIAALGVGASFKIINQFRINAEYFLVQNHDTPSLKYYNPLSMGICYQTSRHAFELFVTNAHGIADNEYIAQTTNNFWKGDVRVGFNISTIFSLNRKK